MTVTQADQPSLWWMGLTRGILLIIFGILMLSWPGRTLLIMIQVLGAYWLVGGAFDLVEGVIGRAKESRWGLILGGIVGMVAGFFVMGHPVVTGLVAGTVLIYFMAAAAVVIGITHIFAGRTGTGDRSVGSFVLGVLYVIFGIIIMFNPLITANVMVWLLPWWAIIAGAFGIVASLFARSVAQPA